MSKFYTAQICKNGHVITAYADEYTYYCENFCSKCGAETIQTCPNCNHPIKGKIADVFNTSQYVQPLYCHSCGSPFPWTKDRIDATQELIELELDLTDLQKQDLANNIYSLVSDSPRTQVAAVKFKSILSKVGKSTASAAKDILVDIISETAKKIIWPN